MFKRWAIVVGIGAFACFVVALAALSLRLETVSSSSTPPGQEAAVAHLPKTIVQLEDDRRIRPVRDPISVADDPALDSLSVEELIDILGSKDNKATRNAANKLETMPAEAVPALIERLSGTFTKGDRFNKLRWWCVNTLGNIKDKRATEVLVKCAALDGDPHTRWRSIWALNVIRDERRIALLKEHLKSEDEIERFNAATALSTMDIADGVKVIEEATKSNDTWLRWQAVSALGKKIRSPETLPLLITCLKDPLDSIRQEAAMSLGRLKDIEAAPALVEALSDKKSGVRWRAARSLGQLGAKNAIPDLIKLLDDSDGSVRGQTAVALGELGCKDRDVAKKVIKMLSDPDRDVRSKAAIAIGRIGTSDDIQALNEALKIEKENRVRRKLERSLRALKTQRAALTAPIPVNWGCSPTMRAA